MAFFARLVHPSVVELTSFSSDALFQDAPRPLHALCPCSNLRLLDDLHLQQGEHSLPLSRSPISAYMLSLTRFLFTPAVSLRRRDAPNPTPRHPLDLYHRAARSVAGLRQLSDRSCVCKVQEPQCHLRRLSQSNRHVDLRPVRFVYLASSCVQAVRDSALLHFRFQ